MRLGAQTDSKWKMENILHSSKLLSNFFRGVGWKT